MAIIVIVDDDPTICMIATEMLRSENYAIVEASDGEEALAVISILPVDLVILDMLMPHKDGLETITELKATRPDVKILAISAGGGMEISLLLRTALSLGADEALSKPLNKESFVHTVARILGEGVGVPVADRNSKSGS
ncbi:response regulator [uncultured Brevundimonas sp.]|uniref:response regulator n=1 Tax=uncultured Brevundimonas sp. TaxID=213418 RepID=UPI0030EDB7B5